MSRFPDHMWLAGDGEGVIFVCEGACPGGDGSLVIATYGQTERRYTNVLTFGIRQLAEFVAFMLDHGRTCREVQP